MLWNAVPTPPNALTPGLQCRVAIDRAERAYNVPPHLLAAIGRVESGRATPQGGVDPWPYSINVDGVDTVFETKAAAVAGVRALQASGVRSIDVGCLQVNLMYHPDAFASLDEAFDPWRNADYGARFLVLLRAKTGSWVTATADYHSATPELGRPYAARVGAALAREAGHAPAPQDGIDPTQPGGMARLAAFGRPALTMPAPSGRFRLTMGASQGLDAYRSHPVALAFRPPPMLPHR